jgi:hypothetical protein
MQERPILWAFLAYAAICNSTGTNEMEAANAAQFIVAGAIRRGQEAA